MITDEAPGLHRVSCFALAQKTTQLTLELNTTAQVPSVLFTNTFCHPGKQHKVLWCPRFSLDVALQVA